MQVNNVKIVEDDSAEKAIKRVANKLDAKYSKKRKINEWFLREWTGAKKVLLSILNCFLVLLIIFACMLCFSTIVSRVNNTVPTFAGFSLMRVSSDSMVASGFDVGENVVVKAVKTDTLKPGDVIAFYVYSPSYVEFDLNNVTRVETTSDKTKSNVNISNFFGFTTDEIKQASNSGCRIVFHEVYAVYEDESGERWFETKGSSNAGIDPFRTNEKYVLGVYDGSGFANAVAGVLNALTNNWVLLLLVLIPFAIFAVILILAFLKDFQKAKLELDVVEEKRKLTDPICVKNQIGYSMDTKTKYKVLAQASEENKKEYLSLLWKDGSAPNSVKKYVFRKSIYLSGVKKLLELNRKCEKMFKDKVEPEKIAEYYITEKEKIQEEQQKKEQRVNKLRGML